MLGRVLLSFGGGKCGDKKQQNKLRCGLRWPLIGKKTHNNQPKTGSRDRGDYGGETRRAGGVGKRDIIVFWRGGSIGEVKS